MSKLLTLFKKWMETSSKKQKWTAVLTILGLLCTVTLFSVNGGSETPRDPLGSTPIYFAGAFIKLVIVLLLIFASAILARRWLQPAFQGKAVRQMRLVETVRLSPKQALHLVSIGDQQLLIGATDHNVTLISQVEGGFDLTEVESTNSQSVPDFGSLLHSFNIPLPGNPSK